jgi:hypothetical protein
LLLTRPTSATGSMAHTRVDQIQSLLDNPHGSLFLGHIDDEASRLMKNILQHFCKPSTYGHSQLKTGHPVRSAIHKQLNGRLVLRWVTTWESLLLYVLCFHPSSSFLLMLCFSKYHHRNLSQGVVLVVSRRGRSDGEDLGRLSFQESCPIRPSLLYKKLTRGQMTYMREDACSY